MRDGYRPLEGFMDEIYAGADAVRSPAVPLVDGLQELGPERLAAAGVRRDSIFIQQGITFDSSSPDDPEPARDRPFPLDLVPRIITAHEWERLRRGLEQRVRALNSFIGDVYSKREIIREGIVPWELVVTRPAFARAMQDVIPPGGVWCHVSGCDIVRDADGSWRVLEDNVRTPSGISYVLENRIAMARLLPELFASYRVRKVEDYPQMLLGALQAVAPRSSPTVVVWTPGPANSAYFEHAFIARQMGVELVEASDLVVRDTTCFMRTTAGLARVDAIYRRLDDAFVDPLEFRADSLLGVPGLMRAYRSGNLALANAPGTGVADDKAVYHYVPAMIRYYLGEQPLLDNVTTYMLSDPEQRAHVIERIDELVVKPTGESGGKGVFIGPTASDEEVAAQIALVERAPGRWVAQETVALSTVPTMTPQGELAPRHVDLRPFAVLGDRFEIVPGGLTRVAMQAGSMIVNSSRGGGSKDTWVLEGAEELDAGEPTTDVFDRPAMPRPRQAAWREQQRQQQQTQSPRHAPPGEAARMRPRGRSPHVRCRGVPG